MADLLDVNVWVALTIRNHSDHAKAREYWEYQASQDLRFCRTTMIGFLRVCSLTGLSPGTTVSVHQAWAYLEGWLRSPGVMATDEPKGVDSCLREWVDAGVISPRTWTDAYLASYAKLSGFRLVSLDSDFTRYPDLDFLHLK